MFEWMAHPVVASGLVAGGVVLITKWIDVVVTRRKQRGEFRVADRELLSKDEQDFRQTVIKQLQQCHDSSKELGRENQKLSKENVQLTGRVELLEVEVDWLERELRHHGIEIPPRSERIRRTGVVRAPDIMDKKET